MKTIKRKFWTVMVMFVFGTSFLALLNMDVVTKMGEDEKNHVYKIPVYLKALNFFELPTE